MIDSRNASREVGNTIKTDNKNLNSKANLHFPVSWLLFYLQTIYSNFNSYISKTIRV